MSASDKCFYIYKNRIMNKEELEIMFNEKFFVEFMRWKEYFWWSIAGIIITSFLDFILFMIIYILTIQSYYFMIKEELWKT
jgi:hypothetical protein